MNWTNLIRNGRLKGNARLRNNSMKNNPVKKSELRVTFKDLANNPKGYWNCTIRIARVELLARS
jgi:hypothetical protein